MRFKEIVPLLPMKTAVDFPPLKRAQLMSAIDQMRTDMNMKVCWGWNHFVMCFHSEACRTNRPLQLVASMGAAAYQNKGRTSGNQSTAMWGHFEIQRLRAGFEGQFQCSVARRWVFDLWPCIFDDECVSSLSIGGNFSASVTPPYSHVFNATYIYSHTIAKILKN